MTPRALWLVPMLSLLAACGHARAVPTFTLTVQPSAESNEGRPVYLLVRAVTPQAYVAQPYAAVAALVGQPDATVRHSEVIFPGRVMTVSIPIPENLQIAVYVLFRRPSGGWRYLFDLPSPTSARVVLREDQMVINPPTGAP